MNQELLAAWEKASLELKDAKALEITLRKEVVAEFFKSPTEGTNSVELAGKRQLKYDHKFSRTIDEAALSAVQDKMSIDKLVKFKPSLALKEYKALSPDLKLIFDEAVIMKPGSPSIEIVEAKK